MAGVGVDVGVRAEAGAGAGVGEEEACAFICGLGVAEDGSIVGTAASFHNSRGLFHCGARIVLLLYIWISLGKLKITPAYY